MYKSLNDAFSNMVPDVETITVDVLIRFSFNESDILKNMKIEKEKEYLRFDLFLKRLQEIKLIGNISFVEFYIPSYNSHLKVNIATEKNEILFPISEIKNNLVEISIDPIYSLSNIKEVQKNIENKKGIRIKERKISEIIKKLREWKILISGSSQRSEKLSLVDAAKKVGLPKKSLDDYLLQVRFGYKYKFNFNENQNQKVGVLRQFVKEKKLEEKRKKKKEKD